MITRSKVDSTNNRRVVFSYLQNKEAIKELFSIVSEKVADRPGGYTRIIKLGNRLGDNAEICFIELVDFNETMLAAAAEKATKTRRSRRAATKKEDSNEVAAVAETPSAEVVEETPSAEVVEEVASAEAIEEAPAEEPASEEPKEDKGEEA
jgi:large subunit ribosomal protein L17